MPIYSFAEIESFCYESVHIDLDRFNAVKVFIEQELQFVPLYSALQQDYSSSARLELKFARDWANLEPNALESKEHFRIRAHVSHRGPFITCRGDELQPRMGGTQEKSNTQFVFRPSSTAEAKAQELAQAIARRFELTYLDRTWLSQQPLSLEKLAPDAISEIDDYDPTALNILFTCYP